ncbi:MAG: transposase [Rikenellaceae bacterium]
MAKLQKISSICNTFSFTEYDYVKTHQVTFRNTELGKLKELFPFKSVCRLLLPTVNRRVPKGRKELFDAEAKVALMILKSRYNLSDRHLIERLNSDIHFQLFCGVIIPADAQLVDFKIVSRIRTELSHELNLNEFQKTIASSLKPHIAANDLRVVMSDASCYESYVRFPTNQKLLWESVEWIHKMMVNHCRLLSIHQPRTKFNAVSEAYLSYAKTRKKTHKKGRKISRRLLHLLEKLINETSAIFSNKEIKLSSQFKKRYNVIKNILEQQTKLFNGEKVTERIISIDKPYLRPIVRGKETKSVEFGAKVNAIQVGGFNFVEHLNFNAFHEGIRVSDCITLHKMLFKMKPRFFAGDVWNS